MTSQMLISGVLETDETWPEKCEIIHYLKVNIAPGFSFLKSLFK